MGSTVRVNSHAGGSSGSLVLRGARGSLVQQIEHMRASGDLPKRINFIASGAPAGRRVIVSSGERTRNQTFVYDAGEEGWKSVYMRFNPMGIRIDQYLKNPVLLFQHGYGGTVHPIGGATPFHQDGKLYADLTFHGLTDYSQTVETLWDAGVYRAVSKSVLVDWDNYTVSEEEILFNGAELVEISVVDIGADPDAIRQALGGKYMDGENEVLEHADDNGTNGGAPGIVTIQQTVERVLSANFADPEFMAALADALDFGVTEQVEQLRLAMAALEETVSAQGVALRALSGEPVVSRVTVPAFAKPQRNTPPPAPPAAASQAALNRQRVSDAAIRRANLLSK